MALLRQVRAHIAMWQKGTLPPALMRKRPCRTWVTQWVLANRVVRAGSKARFYDPSETDTKAG